MATITLNENAPSETPNVFFAGLPPEGVNSFPYETDNREALANAEAHPWLTVEYPEQVELGFEPRVTSVPWEEDSLSGANNADAFDPEQVRAIEEAKLVDQTAVVAVDSGLDQAEPVSEGGVDLTLAADDTEGSSNSWGAPTNDDDEERS